MLGESLQPGEHERLLRVLRESEILREIAELLASSLDTTHILQILVQKVTDVCEIGRCAVWLYDENGVRFRPASYHLNAPQLKPANIQMMERFWRNSFLPVKTNLSDQSLSEHGTLVIDDLREIPDLREVAEKFLVQSVLLVILRREQRILGIMSLDNPDSATTFSEDQKKLARAIGQQAAVAIDNSRVYQQAQDQRKRAERLIERAQAIYQVAMAVNSDKELSAVLDIAARNLMRGLNAEGATITLLQGDTLSVVRPTRLPSLADQAGEYIIPGLSDLTHCLQAAYERQPIFVKASDLFGIERQWYRQIGLENVLIIPLLAGPQHRHERKPVGMPILDDVSCVGFAFATYASEQPPPPPGYQAFAQDIAAQCALAISKANLLDRANEAARLATEQAHTLSAVFNAMTEGIIVVDLNGRVLLTNNTAAHFLGPDAYNMQRLTTFLQDHPTFTPQDKLMPPEEFPLMRALRGEPVRGTRFITKRADGSRRHLEVNIVPMQDNDGNTIGLVSAFRDITEQSRVERRIRRALDTMLHASKAISNLSDITEIACSVLSMTLNTIGSPRGVVQLYNPGQQTFVPAHQIGFSDEEVSAWLSEQQAWLAPADGTSNSLRDQLLEGHATLINQEHCPELLSLPAETMILAVPIMHNKRLLGIMLLDRPRTTRTTQSHVRREFSIWDIPLVEGIAQFAGLALEQARWQQEAAIAYSNEATMRDLNAHKDEFLSMTAHEFREPLTIILGYSQKVARYLSKIKDLPSELTERLFDDLSNIDSQTRHLANIVTTFLDVARLNRGQITLTLEEVDLEEIVQQTVGGHSTTSLLHEMRYEIEDDDRPYLLHGDRTRLQQILGNLLQNAIKYSPQGGSITITLRHMIDEEGRPCVETRVQDQGIGIPQEARAHLFERFYRASNSDGSEARGLGLGLYIVSEFLRLHGGNIRVESNGVEGEGSCFIFTLPLVETPVLEVHESSIDDENSIT
jgi:PAS domain S-box-containing protein